eukprot:8938807-Alexandrium_andersonii.AAC.1
MHAGLPGQRSCWFTSSGEKDPRAKRDGTRSSACACASTAREHAHHVMPAWYAHVTQDARAHVPTRPAPPHADR